MVNSSIIVSSDTQLTFDDAYKFCYELDSRARLLEIHTEEQKDILGIILGYHTNK